MNGLNFNQLTGEHQELLTKAPVFVSLLAAGKYDGISKQEKKEAVGLAHIRSFASDPLLREYYEEVDKDFRRNLETLDKQLPKDFDKRKEVIRSKLEDVSIILERMDPAFTKALKKSLKTFADHVSEADKNVMEYFLFPLDIKGITE